MDYCPNCDADTIMHGTCQRCCRNFRTGNMVRVAARREVFFRADIPRVKEIVPNRVAKVFRDSNWKYEKGSRCGLLYGGGTRNGFPESRPSRRPVR